MKEFTLLDCLKLAIRVHAGQEDKLGRPYIEHLMRVTVGVQARGGSLWAQMAALLHDSIEDDRCTEQDLEDAGVPAEVLVILENMTKLDGETYPDYIRRICGCDLDTLIVKDSDLDDNADEERLTQLPADVAGRLRAKYANARNAVRGVMEAVITMQRLHPGAKL